MSDIWSILTVHALALVPTLPVRIAIAQDHSGAAAQIFGPQLCSARIELVTYPGSRIVARDTTRRIILGETGVGASRYKGKGQLIGLVPFYGLSGVIGGVFPVAQGHTW
jgi:hypothetical protein